ncbi:hypothetical protein [Tengunoibacter tsumagoiensis]|uniref:3-keto-disaccharide hydrolase domain-containing protein n=1 Tax=Tengunoibacter tsumagoiensis TaxID=2014871 RepID=A0A402A4A4_9CHLR|nr:hypothetical protein [Tengunoibacter tsumagoiensis]GCE13942.1 hypothetical protein KTT_38010 [Tengunoibacter tsumagoiensis]
MSERTPEEVQPSLATETTLPLTTPLPREELPETGIPQPPTTTKPVWPPPPRTRKSTRLSTILKVIVLVLALLLVIGGFSFITYSTTTQFRSSITSSLAAEVKATSSVQKTAQAQAQSTANALNTAQTNIEATATAQSDTVAQATAAVDNATATASALGDLYTNSTNGTPLFDDPLSDNTGAGKWDEGAPSTNTGCTFSTTDVMYHVSEATQGYLQPCVAQATRFSSFAYQARLTINKGNPGQAGLLFRIDSTNKNYYFFHIGSDGSYALDLYQNANPNTLIKGRNSAITIGMGQSNTLAVIANSNRINLYANGTYLDSVNDSTFSAGKIGLGVINQGTPIDVSCSDAQVWSLQSSDPSLSSPTPDPFASPTPSASASADATGTTKAKTGQ